jgi:hypothetical protein
MYLIVYATMFAMYPIMQYQFSFYYNRLNDRNTPPLKHLLLAGYGAVGGGAGATKPHSAFRARILADTTTRSCTA